METPMSKLHRRLTLAAILLVAGTIGPMATVGAQTTTPPTQPTTPATPSQPAPPAQATTPAVPTPPAAPVTAAPVTPGAPAVAAPATEELENPYGLQAMWKHGDAVAKGVLILLVIMSMGTWYILFTKLWEQHRLMRDAKKSNKKFWDAPSVQQGIDGLEKDGAFHFIATQGADATKHHGGLLQHVDLNTWVTMSIQRAVESVQNRLQDGLAFLATVGSTAPFIGLFGTVWGILNALTAIGVAGQASIDKVAGPVGEALIMTAIGLAVAVPAVLGYNWLVRRNKTAMEQVRAFSLDLHSVLLGSVATAKRS
jgi:biopolymer transport protein ExbB